ncbi:MAG TPA: hypothetical protein VGP19_12765 [Candidatus Acidoferrales bacterium]|jgi:hypothetical protein|nr:hypothetical protein [Candidatus Acidoferrales bacterium]
MKKQCIVVAAAVALGFLSVFGAAAQGPGPQGVGAEKAAQSSDAPRSYNPIKWIKKDPSKTTEKPKKAKNKKASEKSATPDTQAPPPKV